MSDFSIFKTAVAARFAQMQKHPMYRTTAVRSDVADWYLASFPEGSNPVFRERAEYDCSECRSFIKAVGHVVNIINGKMVSLWDIEVSDLTYQTVADALSEYVKSFPIDNFFLHTEPVAGVDRNFEQLVTGTTTWQHFFVNISASLVLRKDAIGAKLSETKSTHDVMLRSLREITTDSVAQVLDLISQNGIYRGEEHKFALESFEKLKKEFDKVTVPGDQDLFVWSHMTGLAPSVATIRNTSIGTLLTDISEGKDLEGSVKSFEAKVAPANYKRPTAIVTKVMIEKAQAQITEMGLMSALTRRHATINDINVSNILYVDRPSKPKMAGNVFEEIAQSLPSKPKSYDKVEEVTIDKFLSEILPRAESVEVLFENRLAPNLVSLIAPLDPTAGSLFKWDNKFSWDYAGGFADSIKERVKSAGGSVTGDLCCRLGWHNTDDLDLRMVEPGNSIIFYGRKNSYITGGQLDIDMNVGHAVRDAVENIYYENRKLMKEGIYKLQVNNYHQRETKDIGFEVEFDYLGGTEVFTYDKATRSGQTVDVVKFEYTHKGGVKIIESLPSTQISKNVWGLTTQTFQKVNVLMYSPNFWDGQMGVGNKHLFFFLEGTVREGTARGFYNEFLKSELEAHRKAFEMVGSKMTTEKEANQLSGLGFSISQRNHIVVRINGAISRELKVTF